MEQKKTNKILPAIIAGLGALYGVSPIDIVPDVIPIVGWIDDLVITGGSLLHLGQAFAKDTSKSFATIIGMIKWTLWIDFRWNFDCYNWFVRSNNLQFV